MEASKERLGATPRRSGGARPRPPPDGLLDRPLAAAPAIPCILPGLIDLPRPTPRLGGAGRLCIILKSPDRERGGGGRRCCIMLRSPDGLRCGGPLCCIILKSPDGRRCGGPRPISDGSKDRLAPTPRPVGADRGILTMNSLHYEYCCIVVYGNEHAPFLPDFFYVPYTPFQSGRQ